MFRRNGLIIFSACVTALAVACGSDGGYAEPTATAEATATSEASEQPTPIVLETSLRVAIEAYVQDQGSRLAGDCPNSQDPDRDRGAWCYFAPSESEGTVTIAVGRTFSDEVYTLTLERAADGSFTITNVEQNPT